MASAEEASSDRSYLDAPSEVDVDITGRDHRMLDLVMSDAAIEHIAVDDHSDLSSSDETAVASLNSVIRCQSADAGPLAGIAPVAASQSVGELETGQSNVVPDTTDDIPTSADSNDVPQTLLAGPDDTCIACKEPAIDKDGVAVTSTDIYIAADENGGRRMENFPAVVVEDGVPNTGANGDAEILSDRDCNPEMIMMDDSIAPTTVDDIPADNDVPCDLGSHHPEEHFLDSINDDAIPGAAGNLADDTWLDVDPYYDATDIAANKPEGVIPSAGNFCQAAEDLVQTSDSEVQLGYEEVNTTRDGDGVCGNLTSEVDGRTEAPIGVQQLGAGIGSTESLPAASASAATIARSLVVPAEVDAVDENCTAEGSLDGRTSGVADADDGKFVQEILPSEFPAPPSTAAAVAAALPISALRVSLSILLFSE